MTAVGVLGGYGSVGRVTVTQLRAWGVGPVVVAGRDRARADVTVDIEDPSELERFCASVRVVVNCTGSAPETRAMAAVAAAANGVPYVDPGGDEPVHELLSGTDAAAPVVLSAGMWPGLTGLLPRRLAVRPHGRLACYVGGRDRFSLAGAADYLAAMGEGSGRTFAVWRDGARMEGAGVSAIEGDVPYFPEPASAVPFLSPEMERLARRLDLAELVFYTVLPGAWVRATLGAVRREPVDAAAVVRASELDLFGRSPYQRLVFQLPDVPAEPTLVLSGRGSSDLTGATAATTVLAVLEGVLPSGVHFAADVLDPGWTAERLCGVDAVTGLRVFAAGTGSRTVVGPMPVRQTAMEEGTL